jgi:hypothetical protein
MSDQQAGKKEMERMILEFFIPAYEAVTGIKCLNTFSNESPDFIIEDSNGSVFGVELVKVMDDYEYLQFENIIRPSSQMDPHETLDIIYQTIESKDAKRSKLYGKLADLTILVLELHHCELSTLNHFLTDEVQNDFTDHGFKEIWLADYTQVEAYRDIELFGLFPEDYWGHYQRKKKKPYG